MYATIAISLVAPTYTKLQIVVQRYKNLAVIVVLVQLDCAADCVMRVDKWHDLDFDLACCRAHQIRIGGKTSYIKINLKLDRTIESQKSSYILGLLEGRAIQRVTEERSFHDGWMSLSFQGAEVECLEWKKAWRGDKLVRCTIETCEREWSTG